MAELVRKKTEACVTAIVFGEDEAQQGIAPAVVDADGNRVEQFEPGLIAYARGGKDIRFNQPSATGGYGEYKRASLHTISAGFRVPYELLTGDQVHRFDISKPDGGRELWRAVDWTPFEIFAVPVGADPAAGFRASNDLHDCVLHRRDTPIQQGASPMTDQTNPAAGDAATPANNQPTAPVATEDATMTEPKAAAPELKVAAVETCAQIQTAQTSTAETEAVATRAREAERDRVSTIYDLAGRLNLERGFAEDLVRRGVTIDESRRLILDQVAAKSDETRTFSQVSVQLGGRDERITRRDAVANALLHRYSPTLFQLEDAARQYRGMTLLELARESLGNAGVNTRGLSRDEVATRALHSTSDFPEILSAVTNKTLRQAYEAYPRTFMLFCRQVLATDFKAMHRMQLGEAPQLLEVGESGEFKRGTLGESKESYKVKTYGRVVAPYTMAISPW